VVHSVKGKEEIIFLFYFNSDLSFLKECDGLMFHYYKNKFESLVYGDV